MANGDAADNTLSCATIDNVADAVDTTLADSNIANEGGAVGNNLAEGGAHFVRGTWKILLEFSERYEPLRREAPCAILLGNVI